MKKLLLTSAFVFVTDELIKILPDKPENLTVAFVPTAADLSEDPWYMVADRDKLIEMGFKVIDLSLKGKTKSEVEAILNQADILFVGGGNTFYLLDEANKSGFTELVPPLVNNGLIYVGGSAGSLLASPSIENAGWEHGDENTVGITNLEALNLVPFLVSPHYSEIKNDSLPTEIAQSKFPVRILKDDQAILAIDDTYTIVGAVEKVKL